jgi:hypothetical protein
MSNNSEQLQETHEPADPNRQSGQSAQDPTLRTGEEPVTGQSAPPSDQAKVPPASETWVKGQPIWETE